MTQLETLIKEYEEEFMYGGIQQAMEELEGLVEEIGNRKFKKMCEIGIADGGTLWLYSHLFGDKNAKFIVTDMTIRPITRRVMEAITKRTEIIFDIYECKNYQFKLKEPVEFLHLDGDHSYNAIKWDYEANYPMVSNGGLIIVHDTLLMDGPIKFRKEMEHKNLKIKTLKGHKNLCDCFGPKRINLLNRQFGMTIITKENA